MTFLAPTPEQTATHSKPQIVSILSAPSKGNGYVAKFTARVNGKLATYLIQFDALPPSEMDYVEEGWEELEEGGTFNKLGGL